MITDTMPHDFEAEKAVICGIVKAENKFKAVDDTKQMIDESAFYSAANRSMFNAVCEMIDKNKIIDEITLSDYLNNKGELEKVGGIAAITDMMNTVISDACLQAHTAIIQDKAKKRDLIRAGETIKEIASSNVENIDEVTETAEKMIFAVSEKYRRNNQIVSMKDLLLDAVTEIEKRCENKKIGGITGIDTKITKLNELTGGLQKGELVILGARPAMGKTTLALNIAMNVARQKIPVVFFSLEMSKEQIADKLISSYSHIEAYYIPLEKIKKGLLTEKEKEQMLELGVKLSEIPLFVDDTPGINITDFRSRVRQLKAEKNIQLAVVDYLQIINSDRKRDNRVQEVADIARKLKDIARELDITVIALAQLSRMIDTRQEKDRRPRLSDLKESGEIEQAADIVMFLYREAYYNPVLKDGKIDTENDKNKDTDLIIAKNRNGETGTGYLSFYYKFSIFRNARKRY